MRLPQNQIEYGQLSDDPMRKAWMAVIVMTLDYLTRALGMQGYAGELDVEAAQWTSVLLSSFVFL